MGLEKLVKGDFREVKSQLELARSLGCYLGSTMEWPHIWAWGWPLVHKPTLGSDELPPRKWQNCLRFLDEVVSIILGEFMGDETIYESSATTTHSIWGCPHLLGKGNLGKASSCPTAITTELLTMAWVLPLPLFSFISLLLPNHHLHSLPLFSLKHSTPVTTALKLLVPFPQVSDGWTLLSTHDSGSSVLRVAFWLPCQNMVTIIFHPSSPFFHPVTLFCSECHLFLLCICLFYYPQHNKAYGHSCLS